MPATWSGDGVFLVFEETTILVVADGRAITERQSDELRGWFAKFYGGEDVEPIQFELGRSERFNGAQSRVDRCDDQTQQTIGQ